MATEMFSALGISDADNHWHCLTFEEAGRRIGYSGSTIDRLVKSGELPCVRLRGVAGRRIRVADLRAYVERSLAVPEPQQRTPYAALPLSTAQIVAIMPPRPR